MQRGGCECEREMPEGKRGSERSRGEQRRGSQVEVGKKKDAEGENASRRVRSLFWTFQ